MAKLYTSNELYALANDFRFFLAVLVTPIAKRAPYLKSRRVQKGYSREALQTRLIDLANRLSLAAQERGKETVPLHQFISTWAKRDAKPADNCAKQLLIIAVSELEHEPDAELKSSNNHEPIQLRGENIPPLVHGRPAGKALTPGRYRAVAALLQAIAEGSATVISSHLVALADDDNAPQYLRALAETDDYRGVIIPPGGTKGAGFRLAVSPAR